MQTATALLSRKSHRAGPALPLLDGAVTLQQARLHEACGPARHSFAAWVSGAVQRADRGPVLWVHLGWQEACPNPDGMIPFCAPGELLFVSVTKMDDLLWTMEEALRAGCAPLVVGDVAELPSLTQVRRLHLAAEQGAGRFGAAPLGLMLTPGPAGGAPGVESRWHLAPTHGRDHAGWALTRLRARTAPEARFDLRMTTKGVAVV